MTERDSGGDLRNLTPQELNHGLGIIFRFIPVVTADNSSNSLGGVELTPEGIASADWGEIFDGFFQEFANGVNRRSRSELLSLARERLKGLLQFSCLTLNAVRCIIDTYSREYSFGFASPRSMITGDLYWLLDFENPSSGGIFDPKTAPHLERKLFLQELDRYERLQFIQDGRVSSGNTPTGEPYYDKETIKRGEENTRNMRQSIDEWKIEYRNKYEEPPSSIQRDTILL